MASTNCYNFLFLDISIDSQSSSYNITSRASQYFRLMAVNIFRVLLGLIDLELLGPPYYEYGRHLDILRQKLI